MSYDTRARANLTVDQLSGGGGITTYPTINDLPLTGMVSGDQALVLSTSKLYVWIDNGTTAGWWNFGAINTSPSITSGNNTPYILATNGDATVITLVAADPEGIPLSWDYSVTAGSLTNGGGATATVTNNGAGQFTVTPTTIEDYAGAFSLTFIASDGVNLGTTVAAFTLAFRVLDSKYTSLLVKALASGANSTFIDSSTNNFTITKNGDTTQGTFSPFSQPDGAWSNYFDGTGDYLSVSTAPVPATGAFTLEMWINADTLAAGRMELFSQYAAGVEGRFTVSVSDDGVNNKVSAFIGTSLGNVALYSTNAISANTWTHVALVRDASNNFHLYIDGTLNASDTSGKAVSIYTSSCYIGVRGDLAEPWFGYMSNVRVVADSTVYTTNFTTPTAPLTAITNTSLLTCQSNRFKDNSTNAFAITVAGNTAVSPFSPFDRLADNPAVHGGGAYFDGTGDYLTVPNSSALDFGSGDFTIELWYYPSGSPGNYAAIIARDGLDYPWTLYHLGTTNTISIQFGSTSGWLSAIMTLVSSPTAQWYHLAITRSSGVFRAFTNGVLAATDSSWSGAIGDATSNMSIGGQGTHYINGYLADVRLVKGTALYTSAFTPPTAPLTAVTNTSLLLNCTNANIIDYSSKNNLKLVGDTAASATQTKYAARSVYFDGTGDYITTTVSPEVVFGTGDFTVECWFYPTTVATTYQGIFDLRSSGYQVVPTFGFNTNTLIWFVNGSFCITSGAVTANAWYHVAVVRSSSETKMYINGTQSGSTYTDTNNYGASTVNIGRYFDGPALNGYIEDLRITKGLARYTANFTPPTSELLG